MESREKLYYLLDQYVKGNYNTEIFSDMFTITYDIEIDYTTLNSEEKTLFEELSRLTARFSSSESDIAIPNVYVSEKEIRVSAQKVYNQLL